jgi:hypothetical protein
LMSCWTWTAMIKGGGICRYDKNKNFSVLA